MTPQQSPSHLPSLPQVLARILDAMYGEELNFQQLADIIHQDPAIAARLLAVANSTSHASSQRCQTVERALLVLGMDTVKTIVITAATRQFFNSFGRNHHGFLKTFWQRSLTMASAARGLAQLIAYRSPDQAYLCGLLADLGQLVLLQQHGQHYLEHYGSAASDRELIAAEQTLFDSPHSHIGAVLVSRWQVDPIMVTALRQHHDPAQQIVDAHPLVKIINLASLLSLPEQGVQQAGLLFDLSEELVEELRIQAQQQMLQLAQALEIDTDMPPTQFNQAAYEQLGHRLSQIWELEQVRAELDRAQDQRQLHLAVQRVANLMTGVEQPVLLLVDPTGSSLQLAGSAPTTALAELALPLEPGRSCSSDALLQQRIISSQETDRLSTFDQNLLRQLGRAELLCLPLLHEAQSLGVLVLSSNGPLPMQTSLLNGLGREMARALANGAPANAEDPAAQLQQRIEEAVHEAGNPLSIIGNYLEMLRLKLRDGQRPEDDIPLIQEEITRVGSILLRLKTPQHPEREGTAVLEINRLIEQLARILESSLFAMRRLRLILQLSPAAPTVAAPAGPVKQILINLLKNAAEALPESGVVVVTTVADIPHNDALFTAITIEDNGPGIPLEIMNRLFLPSASTKGDDHAGHGLSVTKRLVDDLDGDITCESGSWGTRFQILIPQS